jgi:hypothetical protein
VLLGKPDVYGAILSGRARSRSSRRRRAVLPLPLPRAAARPGSFRRAPRAACSACCPGSSARCRRVEAIKWILGVGEGWAAAS